MNEIEIIKKLRSGDVGAFEFLFKNYYSRLFAFVRTFVDNDLFAEDLVQGVFTSLWVMREEIDAEKSISSYLMKMTKNACLDHLKHQIVKEKYVNEIKRTESQQLYYFDFFETKVNSSVEEELNKSINSILELMPEKCKIVFRMRWVNGFKNREIAEKLNISTTMVEKHLAKGINIFKINFHKEYVLFLIFLINKFV